MGRMEDKKMCDTETKKTDATLILQRNEIHWVHKEEDDHIPMICVDKADLFFLDTWVQGTVIELKFKAGPGIQDSVEHDTRTFRFQWENSGCILVESGRVRGEPALLRFGIYDGLGDWLRMRFQVGDFITVHVRPHKVKVEHKHIKNIVRRRVTIEVECEVDIVEGMPNWDIGQILHGMAITMPGRLGNFKKVKLLNDKVRIDCLDEENYAVAIWEPNHKLPTFRGDTKIFE